jgi:hypothetical protein
MDENRIFNYLKPLVGAKITKVIVDPSPEGVYLGFIVEKKDQTFEILGLADPEGNGPGHIQITKLAKFGQPHNSPVRA